MFPAVITRLGPGLTLCSPFAFAMVNAYHPKPVKAPLSAACGRQHLALCGCLDDCIDHLPPGCQLSACAGCVYLPPELARNMDVVWSDGNISRCTRPVMTNRFNLLSEDSSSYKDGCDDGLCMRQC